MSFISSLVRDVKGVFGGNNKAPQKKKDQTSQNQPVTVVRPQKPGSTPIQARTTTPDQTPIAAAPSVNLTNLSPASLQKVTPGRPSPVPTAPPPPAAAPAPHASILHDITHNPVTNAVGTGAKAAGSVAAGASLGVLRAGTGLVEGVTQIPKVAVDLGTWGGDKLSGTHYRPGFVKAIDHATDVVDKPFDAVNRTIDQAAQVYGGPGKAVYTPTQIAANVATLVPGAAALLSKVSETRNLGKLGDAANAVNDFSNSQIVRSPVMQAVNDAKNIVKSKAPALAGPPRPLGPAPTEPRPNEVAPGITSKNPAAAEGFVSPHEQLATEQAQAAAQAAADNPTPAFQRQAAQQPAPTGPVELTDTPSFERQGKALPSQNPAPAAVDTALRDNAATIARDPQHAGLISDAYRTTGGTNPLSLVMHALSKTTDKGTVRSLVQRLIPEADGNVLNQAVKRITAAHDPAEVAQVLSEAGSGAHAPTPELGPLSDAPAPRPTAPQVSAEHPDAQKIIAANTPKPVETPAPVEPLPIEPHAMNDHEQQVLADLDKKSKTQILTTEDKATRKALRNKADAIDQANNPEPVKPAETTPAKPETKPSEQVPAAPNTHDAAVRNIVDKELQQSLKGQYGTRDKVDLATLHENAANTVDKMSPGELAAKYANGADLKGPQDIVDAIHALQAIGDHPLTESSVNAADHLAQALADVQTKAGQAMRVGQVLWENMPSKLKSATMVNRLARNGIDTTAEQEKKLLDLLVSSDDVLKTQREAEAALAKLEEGMRNKTIDAGSPNTTAQVKAATAARDEAVRAHEFADGETFDYYRSLLPKGSVGDRLAQSARVFMLSAPTGRFHDFISTGSVSAIDTATDVVHAGLNKAVNLIKGNKKLPDSLPSPSKYGKGLVEGVKDTGRAMKGDHRVEDFNGVVKQAATRSNLAPAKLTTWRNPIKKLASMTKNVAVAATESPTFLTKGRQLDKLSQLARQDGKRAGLKGQALKNFTEVNMRLRSKADEFLAQQEHLKVNNLHSNKVAQAASGVIQSIQTAAKGNKLAENVIPQIINQVAPFTSWVAGNVSRTLTDANMLSNATRLYHALRAGNTAEATAQAAKLVTNGGLFAAGTVLTADGSIVNHDANGKNYAGAYFHIGNRYIPVGILGPFAAPIIFGNATHNASQKPGGIRNVKNISEAMLEAGGNTIKSVGVSSTLGGSNAVQSGISTVGADRGSLGDVLPKMLGGAVGQYVPGVTRDVNAYLDTHSGLNPTKEAPLTKVTETNPKTGRQVTNQTKTAINQVKSAIPGVSQKLPRQTGTPARDLTDRALQGSHDTPKMASERITKAKDAKTLADTQAANAKAGIPDPTDGAQYAKGDSFDKAVENRIENKQYDQAIKGLQQKLDLAKNGPDPTTKDIEPIRKQLAVAKVLKAGDYDPGVRDLYGGKTSGTSLTEWRNMGDPESDSYDPETYKLLYNYDKELAAANASAGKTSSEPKYYAKTDTAKEKASKAAAASRKAATAAANLIKSNTVGSTPNLPKFDFGSLAPEKITDVNAKMPTIQQIPSSQLVKKRSISVNNSA